VAINPDYIGRTFEPSEPYEVSRVKIAEFADAIGEPSSLCRDRSAAQAAGYPDVIAPPTFAIVVTAATTAKLIADPGLGVNYAMVVHGEQSFTHSRPLHAGDVVVAQSTIESIKQIGSMTTMATVTEVRTVDGENVCTARSTLVERGA
jgi:acyl dehydratase